MAAKTRMKNEKALEEQIAYLRWCRMQNERQIRTSLELTRSLQERDEILRVSHNKSTANTEWMHSVIEDELSKPLVLSDAEMHSQGLFWKPVALQSDLHTRLLDHIRESL